MTDFTTLYKRNSDGSIQQWQIVVEGDTFKTLAGQKDGKIVESGPTYCEAKNVGKANETTGEQQAIKEAQAKFDKKLKSSYVEDISKIDEILFVQPMLAKKWDDHKSKLYNDSPRYKDFKFPVYVDLKFNGIRCERHIKGVFSRKGEQFFTIPHIVQSTESLFVDNPKLVLDGELYNFEHREHLNRITKLVSVARKAKDVSEDILEESKNIVEYHVYDAYDFNDSELGYISKDLPFSVRKQALARLIKDIPYVFCVKSEIAKDEEEVDVIVKRHIENGEEGGIIRVDGPYENKRSDKLLKYKMFIDAEFEIVKIEEGNGNWKGCAKKIYCKTKDGQIFKSNVEGKMEFCKNVFDNKDQYTGKVITVRFQNYSEYGIPQLPYTDMVVRDYE